MITVTRMHLLEMEDGITIAINFHQLEYFLRAACVPGMTLRAGDAGVPVTPHLPSKEKEMQTHV